MMQIIEFRQLITITSEIKLKDGRRLLTTDNGFTYWVVSKKGAVDEINFAYYKKALQLKETKRSRNAIK